MKKLLIVCRQQFGYLVDIYKWCEHLSDEYQIEVVTFDGKEKIALNRPNVKVHYVSYKGNKTMRGIRYILVALWHMLFFKGNILVEYFNGCSVFKKLLPWKNMILDIRTLSIKKDEEARTAENNIIKSTSDKYNFTTIISEGTRKAISLDESKSAILPLGADIISTTDKKYDKLRLLYVGTLSGRDIHKTIEGLSIYLKENSGINIHYDIIGDGYAGELDALKAQADKIGIEKHITFHGFMPHNRITSYLDNCNVGVSFVPITKCYEHQPPTKTYEYILSGLYTIATETFSNKEIITAENGILIDDTAEAFAKGLAHINKVADTLKSDTIRNTLTDSTWEVIVRNKLERILTTI